MKQSEWIFVAVLIGLVYALSYFSGRVALALMGLLLLSLLVLRSDSIRYLIYGGEARNG